MSKTTIARAFNPRRTLTCVNCPATAKDTSKERNRFLIRHPKLCTEHQNKHSEKAQFTQALAEGVRSVE